MKKRKSKNHEIGSDSWPEWQNISTAPKDGSRILLCRVFKGRVIAKGIGYFGQRYHPISAHVEHEKDCWVDGTYRFPAPTHWMPCPPDPT